MVTDLRALVPIDPNHLPQAIAAIEAVGRAYPAVPQVVCFDTAFHSRMPRVARLYALPGRSRRRASSATASTASPTST